MASRAETTTIPQFAADIADHLSKSAGVEVEIVGRVGGGASGEVFHAFVDRKTVALKVFEPGASLEVAVLERFIRERRDSLRHPNLMPVTRVSSARGPRRSPAASGEARVYCTMPLLAGDALEVVMADLERGHADQPSLTALAVGPRGEIHSLLPRRAAQLFAEVTEGLSVAHGAGIVHGRLHPRNLIFSPTGRLVITDFGLRAALGEESCSALGRDCLAPEEKEKSSPSGTTAADVYALGTMLRQVLTCGERLRQGQVPRALDACIQKATARAARDRYESARDFAADLRRFLNHDEPRALLERELLEAEAEESESSRDRHEQRLVAVQLENATRLLEEERSGRERLRIEVEEERRKRAQEARERSAREAEMAAFVARRGRLFRWVAVAMLSSTTALFVWALVESDLRRETSKQATQIRALVDRGDVVQALEESRRAGARSPDDQVAGALTLLARNTAAKEALVGAVKAVADNRIDSAANAVRAAAAYIEREDGTVLKAVGRRLDEAAARDPVEAGLESPSERKHLIALDHLEVDVRQGMRPAREALLALRVPALAPPRPPSPDGRPAERGPEFADATIFRRALRVAALAGRSAPILARLLIGEEQSPVTMREEQFKALHETLETIADDVALSLLCSWTAAARRELDTARAPAQIFMAPNILVAIDRNEQRDYMGRWMDLVVHHDPQELVLAARELIRTPALVPRLIDELAAIGSDEARDFLADFVKSKPLIAGTRGLKALERLGAFEPLLDIAREEYPLAFRVAALEELAEDLYPFCLRELRTIALTSPYPELRRAAFRALSQSDSPVAVSAIAKAVDDSELRESALQWLAGLPPERCAKEALALLEHPKGRVRRAAVSVLSEVEDARLLVPLTARLFAESPGVRAAALSLLKQKAALLGKQGAPEQPGNLVNRVLRSVGYPFRRAGPLREIPSVRVWWNEARAALRRAFESLVDAEKRNLWIQALADRLLSSDD